MLYAKSIYLGGQIIEASDPQLNYSSYRNLGLRCVSCGEEVFFKKGIKKEPHFAHFKVINNNINCPFRLSAQSVDSWKLLNYEGKKQRRDLFNQYLLEIIENSFPECLDVVFLLTSEDQEIFDNLVQNTIELIRIDKQSVFKRVKSYQDDNFEEYNRDFSFVKIVVLEVIDYICLDYRKETLNHLTTINGINSDIDVRKHSFGNYELND